MASSLATTAADEAGAVRQSSPWVMAAGAGLAALVATSQTAYAVLRVVGGGVLVALGLRVATETG